MTNFWETKSSYVDSGFVKICDELDLWAAIATSTTGIPTTPNMYFTPLLARLWATIWYPSIFTHK